MRTACYREGGLSGTTVSSTRRSAGRKARAAAWMSEGASARKRGMILSRAACRTVERRRSRCSGVSFGRVVHPRSRRSGDAWRRRKACSSERSASDARYRAAYLRCPSTSSAISQRIAALETELGYPLLIRSRPCRPTSAGQRLLPVMRRPDQAFRGVPRAPRDLGALPRQRAEARLAFLADRALAEAVRPLVELEHRRAVVEHVVALVLEVVAPALRV